MSYFILSCYFLFSKFMSYIRNVNRISNFQFTFSYQIKDKLFSEIFQQKLSFMINKKNLTHQLEVINNERYENICQKLKKTHLSSQKLKQEEQQNKQNHQNLSKNHQNHQNFEDICFELKSKVQLPRPSQALLLFYQCFENKLVQKLKERQFYGVKQILVQFYPEEISQSRAQFDKNSNEKGQQNDQQQIAPLSILIRPFQAVIYRIQRNPIVIPFKDTVLFNEFTKDNTLKELEEKIWLQINKKLNKISLHIGDIQPNEKKQTILLSEKLFEDNFKKENLDWKHCQKKFDENDQISRYSKQSMILQNLKHCKILIKTFHKKAEENIPSNLEKNWNHQVLLMSLAQNLSISMVQLQTLRGPKIQQNPNLFNQSISSIYTLPSQIQTLYFRMKNMNLVTICQEYSNFKDFQYKLDQQLIGSAIHNSLVTPFGYFTDKKGTKIPIGILNHLLYVKTNKKYQSHINSIKSNKSLYEFYQNLTTERQGYIRFQIIHPHNFYPGNCGILEIWPPFNCSPIHNHGQLIGVVKVIKGDLRIQNYLSLCCNKQKHFAKTDLHKGEYTWLCKESYGIHRIINPTPSTAISLQAYYDHNQGSEEYFTFLMKQKSKDKNQLKFAKYYPQHDWINYLNMQSIENQEDRNFIKQIIKKYGLKKQQSKNQQQKLDYSFGKFIQVFLKEYYLIRSFLNG